MVRPILTPYLETTMQEPKRVRLPSKRPAIVLKQEIDGHEFFITVSFYDDALNHAHPGEVFVVGANMQAKAVNAAIQAWALAMSMLMQYGTPWEKIYAKYRDGDALTRGITEAIQSCVDERRRIVGMDEPPLSADRDLPGRV